VGSIPSTGTIPQSTGGHACVAKSPSVAVTAPAA